MGSNSNGDNFLKFILYCVTLDLSDNPTEMRQISLSKKPVDVIHTVVTYHSYCKIIVFFSAKFSSQPDEDLVEMEIVNYLEEHEFKICWHQREFMPGTNIAENIADATECSRRMIFAISRYGCRILHL